jgi:ABC-type polysaccharide transport system permease subunit
MSLNAAKSEERKLLFKRTMKNAAASWELYLFLLIPVAFIIIFRYIPMYGVQIAFKQFTFQRGIWGSPWVGLTQFKRFFTSPVFFQLLRNTLNLSLYSLFAVFPIPIILALALNSMRSVHYKKFIQMVTYLPHFISVVVLVGMLYTLLNPRIGMYGILYKAATGTYPRDLISNAKLFPHIFVWSGAWQNVGYNSIIFLAALSAVDPELHEAAMIDGASRFKRVLHVDIPAILPTIVILLILRCGSIMGVSYEKAFLMQNDLNRATSQIISTYVYQVGLQSGTGNYSYAAAIGLFDSVVNLILLVFVNQISRRAGETSLW